ncbi:MAG: hypothetical protein JRF55_17350 [Deltaproteobacteria bacterium]|nr:hypothetical protein [Deltaproteobacteria bacterium]
MRTKQLAKRAILLLTLVDFAWFPAKAEGQLGPDGTPITTSNYTVDLTRGVVISTSRVIGLSGAATSLAQGVEGGLQNPAAVAYRGPQWPDWYDYWLAFGVTYPFKSGDFYNSGQVVGDRQNIGDDTTVFLIPGVYWQMWNFGIGLTIDAQFVKQQGVRNPVTMEQETLRLRFTTFHIQAGYGFLDGQLIVGAGLRILRQRTFLSSSAISDDLYQTLGLGAEVGLMFRPHHRRWSLGGSLFPEISTGIHSTGSVTPNPDGDIVVGGYYVPRSTRLPTTGSAGFSYQFGPRPTNPPWISAEMLAEKELDRLKRRKRAAEEREKEEIAEVQARGGPDVEVCVQAVRQRYARKYAKIKQTRKEMKKLAWDMLRKQYRWGWPRRYYLLTADLWFSGRVDNGVGVESFLFQTVQRSGEKVTVSPRLGFETEVWPTRMKLRGGTYLEPTRFAASTPRVHGTLGFDISLFKWNVFGLWPDDYRWQVTVAVDLARAYGSFSFGIGGWY